MLVAIPAMFFSFYQGHNCHVSYGFYLSSANSLILRLFKILQVWFRVKIEVIQVYAYYQG